MSNSILLQRAKRLIQDPMRWTVHVRARDERGSEVNATSKEACAFCAIGAVERAASELGMAWRPAIEFLRGAVNDEPPWRINDRGDHTQVMKMFDDAIELAEFDERKAPQHPND